MDRIIKELKEHQDKKYNVNMSTESVLNIKQEQIHRLNVLIIMKLNFIFIKMYSLEQRKLNPK